MARKKPNIKERLEQDMAELDTLDEGSTFVGTPTMVLLPAKNYYFRILKSKYTITIPREVLLKDLPEDLFPEEKEDFVVLEDNYLDVTSITKILFAVSKYPALTANQLFTPATLKFKDDSIEIVGRVIEILDPASI